MCGICGFNWEDERLIKAMAGVMQHRGPDSEGFYVNKVSLGHRRLSIIDLSERGSQPMCNRDKSAWIIYNGEVYNFSEIREKLKKKGHIFHSESDTEVIIAAYYEYGKDCVKHFNGMFAFCIYDLKKNILFLARDRIGVKPLYYYHSHKEGKFIFASEIKALLEHDIKRIPNNQAIADYLTFQNIMDNKTFMKDIWLLEPGKYIIYDLKKKRLESKAYWELNLGSGAARPAKNAEEYVHMFRDAFKESVRRHMISDVPVGAYVSGGFDSGSVTAQASELVREKKKSFRLDTFTARFKEGGFYDETKCSRALARKYNAKAHEVTIGPSDFLKSVNKFVYHLDEPRAGFPAIAAYHVAQEASKHVTVVLTGHGGDEFFAGYPVYKSFYIKSLIKKNPLNIFRALGMFKLSEMPRAAYYLVFPFFQKETKHGFFIIFNERQRKRLFSQGFFDGLNGYEPVQSLTKHYHKDYDAIQNLQALYIKAYLPSMLIVEDKISMAHSIEGRIPFCDNDMVSLSMMAPLDVKLHNKTLKYLIKEGMREKLPGIYYSQPKKGFPTPLSLWLRKELKQYTYSLLLSERTAARKIFNQDYVKKLLDRHCSRKSDGLLDLVNAARIWDLINIELWFRLFIDKEKKMLKEVRS